MQKIKIESVGYDPKYYPRVSGHEYWRNVFVLKKKLQAKPSLAECNKPKAFPPVIVVRRSGWDWPFMLLDGLHRLKAHHGAGYDMLFAEIERLPKSKWFARAAELNLEVRCNLTPNDLAWICVRLEADGWSEQKAADHMQIELKDIQKIKLEHVVKLKGKGQKISDGPVTSADRQVNGSRYGFLKGPLKGVAGTANANKALAAQDAMFGASQHSICDSFLALLRSGAVNVQDAALMEKIKEIRSECEQIL